jgi:hypothetical protein
MTKETGESQEAVEGSQGGRDPLASQTLAALYASQGHAHMADAIYSQLGQHPGEPGGAPTGGETSGGSTAASLLLEKLLSLREAARRVRELRESPSEPDGSHGR